MAEFLGKRLDKIRATGNYRTLSGSVSGVDFWSNDYLGLARTRVQGKVKGVVEAAAETSHFPLPTSDLILPTTNFRPGSRSISADHDEWHATERMIAAYHGHAAALVFSSGYTANLGLLSAILRRTDMILYDELMHASCRDGIRLGQARAVRFAHNQLTEADLIAARAKRPDGQLFVLTEGRFSMDGDLAPLSAMTELCDRHGAHLIVDEAHSGGLEGVGGAGLVAELGLQDRVFATVVTYGKAFGAHGAAVLGGENLKDYLVNVCRPFIYTTGPGPARWQAIREAYANLEAHHADRMATLQGRIGQFRAGISAAGVAYQLPPVNGPIQALLVPGNERVMAVESACRTAGLLVKGIRSPTVAAGAERVRICLHAFNTEGEVERLVAALSRQHG